jgi:hypothetical protein
MSNEELSQAVKHIVTLAKDGNVDGSYQAYRELFERPEFGTYRPQDQRQVLRLMVLAKHPPKPPTPAMMDAHRAAIGPLTELVSTQSEPIDHEMLGICHVLLGNEDAAGVIFRAGLALERERNPQSDLCGTLMRRISEL